MPIKLNIKIRGRKFFLPKKRRLVHRLPMIVVKKIEFEEVETKVNWLKEGF